MTTAATWKAITLGGLLVAALPAYPAVYKWVDADGHTHYSQTAAPEQHATELAAPAPPQDAGEPKSSRQPDKIMQELEAIQKSGKAQRQAQEQEASERDAARRKARCANLRYNLGVLRQQVPVYNVNENGERVYLDDEGRAAEIGRLTEEVAAACGG